MKTVSEESAPAAEFEQHLDTPNSLGEAMETGFLPDDEHYRLTGEFRKETPSEKSEESAASKTPEKKSASAAATQENENESGNDEASAASSSKAAPSESAQTQNQGRESRWQKRENELKKLREENARLKSGQSTQQTRSETQQPSQAATESTAAPKPKIDNVDPQTNKPKYKTYGEYEDAKDAWLRQDTLREFNESQAKTQQLTQQQQAEREIGQTLTKKFEPLRAKYADFDKVALSDALTIPKGSVAELFILDSDHAGEVLYHLGQHPEILQGFYRDHDPKTGKFTSLITPQRQFRKLMEIEAQFSGTASSGKSGDDKSSSSSAKPVTQASRPPHQVSGTGTVAKDAVEQALEDGDFETYQRAQNAKELARLKKK